MRQGTWTTDHESWIRVRGYGLWLLTNQLYWPTSKSIAPALCFGFAVDGGGCFAESQALVIFWSIPKKCYTRQAGAVLEGRIPDAGDTLRDRDAGQVGAFIEG